MLVLKEVTFTVTAAGEEAHATCFIPAGVPLAALVQQIVPAAFDATKAEALRVQQAVQAALRN